MGPLPFGYNTQFASPEIPFTGKGGTRILLGLVGQMDTVFRILNPGQFLESRTSVPIGAFNTQREAEDFYGDSIDEMGRVPANQQYNQPGGVSGSSGGQATWDRYGRGELN